MLDNDNLERKKIPNAIADASNIQTAWTIFQWSAPPHAAPKITSKRPSQMQIFALFFHKFQLGLNTTFCTQNRVRESRALETAFWRLNDEISDFEWAH